MPGSVPARRGRKQVLFDARQHRELRDAPVRPARSVSQRSGGSPHTRPRSRRDERVSSVRSSGAPGRTRRPSDPSSRYVLFDRFFGAVGDEDLGMLQSPSAKKIPRRDGGQVVFDGGPFSDAVRKPWPARQKTRRCARELTFGHHRGLSIPSISDPWTPPPRRAGSLPRARRPPRLPRRDRRRRPSSPIQASRACSARPRGRGGDSITT